jgi:hypothetical protein
MNSEIYEVKKCAGVPGLLVTDHVYPPGRKFTKDEWKWSDETLAAALENGRCVKVEPEKEEVKIEKEPESEKELTVDDKLKILEGMMKEYENLPEDTRKAKTLLRRIKKLEAEIK